jgi:photosynthetic reaction center cytochrome c subunit
MRSTPGSFRVIGVTACLTLTAALLVFAQLKAQAPAPAQPVRTAEQQFKNIKVLKGTPAAQLIIGMHLAEGALGVECGYCHYEDDFSKDGKETKDTARKMMAMVMDINKNNFEGKQVVTCYTCHHGNNQPVSVPILPETLAMITPYGAEPPANTLPTADQILAKYVQAIGGEQAIRKVTSRVITATRDVPTGPGGTVAIPAQAEEYQKAPNLIVNIVHTSTTTTSDGFDGSSAWAQNAAGVVADAPSPDQERAKRGASLFESADLKKEYTRMVVRGVESVNGRSAYLVVGFPANDSAEWLYFDVTTGLLVRKRTVLQSPLGDMPFETDYDDYRDTGSGARIPFWIRTIPATPRSAFASRSSIRIQKVQDNAPIDDGKFTKPASKPQPPAARP